MATRSMETGEKLLTVEEYKNLPEDDGYKDELVRGRLVREPRPRNIHDLIKTELTVELSQFVKKHDLGVVMAEGGFMLATHPGTIRGPDVAFVSEERIPPERFEKTWLELSPDLAVEVISPSNTAAEMHEKVGEYLDGGSRLVWLVYPDKRTITVYRSRDDISMLCEDDVLDGGDVLPGFRLRVGDVFAR